ncbi:hypothetical protein Clacol_007063 [Clathrus columnatus]|uniref:F-box domain-containing protein n=1 Tax=Clathrus columnatus TaxID=1419009 RepID=A0AAV5AI88_9AGAM|nr:hypothetical protein Clacol_007063 [Clathrus columnatus]
MRYPKGLPLHTAWEEIASHLNSTSDLLSLALTCHIFKELIIPDHLEFRHIRCDIRRNDVWKSLSSRPRPTRCILTLDLIHEPGEGVRLPRSLGWDKPDQTLHMTVPVTSENMKFFKDALSHMACLKVFSWKQYKASFPETIDVSRVLTNTTHCLEALRVDFRYMSSLNDRTQFENLSVWNLTNLKKVAIRHPGPAAVEMIVHLCPDIEDLYLDLSLTSFLYVMQHGNWKKLRRLNLSINFGPLPIFVPRDLDNPMIIGLFFVRNNNIESLYLEPWGVSMPDSLFLPKLRSIGSHHNFLPTSCLSRDTLLGLVHWQCPSGDIDFETLPKMNRLESFYLSTSSSCESFLASFIQKAHNLKKMYLKIGNYNEMDIPEILVNSCQCSKLTHLIWWVGNPPVNILPGKPSTEQLEVCKKLSTLPALTYIAEPDAKICVKLLRDQDGIYSGYQLVAFEEVEEHPDRWSDFFTSIC